MTFASSTELDQRRACPAAPRAQMQMRFKELAIITLANLSVGASSSVSAQPAAGLPKVEVSGSALDVDERAESTTTKIVVNRDEIVRYGDRYLTDILKRLPGVTVLPTPNGSDIRMRGLGTGYTQILVNGNAMPQGFSLDSLSPESVERIEVIRVPSAEVGTQAVAGTINVILKSDVRRGQVELKLTAASEDSRPSYGFSAQLADRHEGLSYTVAATADRKETTPFTTTIDTGGTAQGQATLHRTGFRDHAYVVQTASLTPRINWKLSGDDALSFDAYVGLTRTVGRQFERSTASLGDPLQYATTDLSFVAPVMLTRANLKWLGHLANDASMTVQVGATGGRRDSNAGMDGYDAQDVFKLHRDVLSEARDRSIYSTGKYAVKLNEGHEFSAGWDGAYTRRGENRIQTDLTPPGPSSIVIDEEYDARVTRLALFAQDEWKISTTLKSYFGLRWEGLQTASVGNVLSEVRNNASVVSPVLQTVWKVSDAPDARIRLGLTRTYKAPLTADLMPRRYIAKNNSPVTPDYQGNPNLRPELAWGLDSALEWGSAKSGSGSLALYRRSIDGVTRQQLYQQNGIWIRRPFNGGSATAYGFEVDGTMPVKFLGMTAVLRGNVARNWSRVHDLPEPNNRLDNQVPLSSSVGVDFGDKASSLAFGGSWTYQRGSTVQMSESLSYQVGSKRAVDLYALWAVRKGASLRISATNLFALGDAGRALYLDSNQYLQLSTSRKLHPQLRVTLEVKL